MFKKKKNALYNLFILLLVSLYGCMLPTRLGKVKKINTNQIKIGDSITMIPVSFTYFNYLHSSYRRWRPDKDDLAYENLWDSVQYSVLQEYFSVRRIDIGPKDSLFKFRPFNFKLLLGGPYQTLSNLNDYNLSLFTWNIRAGRTEKAFEFLPDTVHKISLEMPVVIFTNDFFFYGSTFQAGYATGGTGLMFIPDCLMAIVFKNKIIYYRNFSKRYSFKRFEKDEHFKAKVTRKLFDKF
jgi:hypothetical protein